FSGCSSLDSISIPGTVTTIGSYAFQGSSLSNATLCEGLTLIGNYAFYGSSSLSSVTLPESLTSIGDWAFSGCSSLSSISIPGKVTSIGRYAFQGSSLSSVTLCEGLTSIGNYAFSKCYSLTGITIPSTVTSISSYAFSGCAFYEEEFFNNSNCKDENNWGAEIIPHGEEIDGMIIKDHVLIYVRRYLASVKIPESVTSIGVEAFKDCILLDSVSIPNSVTSIGDDAFYNCSSLSSVSLPDSLTSIGDLAFSGCSSLDSISIPGKVTSIGDYAFYNCSSLSSVNLPESLTSIGDWAFSGCSSLSSVDIPNSVTSIGDDAFYNCSKLSSVTLPDSLTSIGDYAFSGCSSLSSMSLPESLTSIGDYAFSGCSSLDSVSIPNSVTSIGNYAFYGCNSLSSVTLSEGLTSIGSYAFYNCSSLGSISIPGKVTSIGDRAFYGCSKLSSVTLPDSLTSIGSYAFYYCSSLKDVHYFGTAEQWSAITIGSSNEPLTEATIHYYENGICTTCGNEYQFATLNAEGYYEISNAGQLFWFAQQVNIGGKTTANALLTADIYLENRVWYPIGLNGEKAQENGENVLAHYDGIFDGNGHTVSNFTVTGNRNSALVGYATDKAIVKKVGVINATTEGQSAAAVLAWGGTVENCYAINCTSTATFFSGGSVCSNSVNSVINSFAVGCVVNADPITSIEPELSPVGGGANATNCYYQNVTTNEELTLSNGQIEVTQEQLASGEVACLLGEAWGQNVDGEGEKDAYPVLGGAKLYRGYNTCAEDAQMVYTNNAGVSAEKPEHSHEDGFCTECGHIDAEGGVTIRDGAYEAFAIAEDMEVNSLTYVRTLPNEDWNSLFVPFEIEVTETFLQNYDVAYFNNMHAYDKDGNGAIDAMDMEVILIKEGTLHANHPYFIRAKSEEAKDINIELGATTLYGTAEENRTCITASSAYMNFQLVGIYEQMVGSEGVYVITTDGTWSPIAEEARLNPFRLFLKMSERSGSPVKVDEQALSHVRIRVAGEGTETGIGELEADGAEVKAEVYDLSGRRVAHPQKGGIYIMAGKKVVL
ncbi:MAG: leucine-rich repeat domain-containing protein, partial [Bacteroidaceae bacterium]|nr:leucine-rich repeat domain-containing protein [Bacteroidaceae bacterium]